MASVLRTLLEIAAAVIGGCLAVMMLYQLGLSFFGFGRKVKDYADHDPQSRFLVLVPAHNEEKVIADIVDNLNRMVFREVNSQYLDKGKPDFIQCYLGAKNKKGVVAWFYYTGYTLTNRFFDLAKHRLGLNCAIGGTGFAMSTEYLYERGGWTTMSLTEDYEIQVEATLEGRRILWNHVTRVYDEKPTSMRASIRQKIRWGQGHWFVTLRNTGKLFRALANGTVGFGEFLSLLTYMYSISAYVLALAQLVISVLLILTGGMTPHLEISWTSLLQGALLFSYSYLVLFYIADWMDNRIPFDIRTIPVMIGGFAANMIVGMFKDHAISGGALTAPQAVRMPPKAA